MKTGLIGLGAMGMPMAENLYHAAALHAVWNRTAAKAEAFSAGKDIMLARSPAELAEHCDVIITSVSADSDLIEVVQALLPGLQRNAVVVDTSTVAVATARQAAELCGMRAAHFIDAPVSGGVEGARRAQLVMMAGGDVNILAQVEPVLLKMAKQVVHMGDTGSGQATKAVNQIMAAGINQAVTESLAFAEAMQLDLDKVIDVISGGAAGNWFLANRGKTMVQQAFEPGFKVGLHHKDLQICRQMTEQLGGHDTRLPLIEMTLIHYQRLIDAGYAEEDISALYRLKQEIFS